jgi:ubiquinone/menaquinone biosynthesis C-methylase UbiE
MHKDNGIHKILNFSKVYDLLQKVAGSDRVYRYLINEELKGSTLLDIGCGTGTIAKFLPIDVDYLGYDFNEKYIDFARKQFHNHPNINFLLLNAYEYLELEKKFDYILVFGLLHHLDDIGVKNV